MTQLVLGFDVGGSPVKSVAEGCEDPQLSAYYLTGM